METLTVLTDSEAIGVSPAAARVALVNMPFGMADRPSIQCGLLKACLVRAGHEVDTHYLNLQLAAEIGADLYFEISHVRSDLLLGDWLFAAAAFDKTGDEEAYREEFPMVLGFCKDQNLDFDELCRMRRETFPAWIQRWADDVDWTRYDLIGFTNTFEQSVASLSLARAIKERHPAVVTVFGGSNFDGSMGKEFVRALPWVDWAVVGEGDNVFPRMVSLLAAGESPVGLPGVIRAEDGKVVGKPPAPLTENLDALPDPDYDDYFKTLFGLGQDKVLADHAPLLLFESARGCWWGEKQHCTFCGLNNNGMKFRSKSAETVLGELRRLSSKYKIVNFEAVDNIIDLRYLEGLCEPLGEQHYDFRLFYETKANITKQQLHKMSRAGIKSIQPGIESLNTHILKLMRKGVTMLRNVRCMKWAYYYGMRISWNLLTGFPGEKEEDYDEQLHVLKVLRHLPPPEGWGRIWMERFSPYFFDKDFPVSNLRPLPCYRYVYPEDRIDIGEIAYFFKYDMANTVPEEYHQPMTDLIDEWKTVWDERPRPALVYQRAPDWIQFMDRRTKKLQAHAFGRTEAEVYEYCGETDRSAGSVVKHLTTTMEIQTDESEVRAILDRFCELGLMLTERDCYLSVALPANPHW